MNRMSVLYWIDTAITDLQAAKTADVLKVEDHLNDAMDSTRRAIDYVYEEED